MAKIWIKPRNGLGDARLFKEVDDGFYTWSYELVPWLKGVDHKNYSIEITSKDGEPIFDSYCDEWCPCCNTEVVIPSFGVSFCPNCGERILPCSMCDTDYNDCRKCPYEKWTK